MLTIAPFDSDLDEVVAFARRFEQEALEHYPALPRPDLTALPDMLNRIAARSHGLVARDRGEVVGCLTVIGQFSNYHGGASGIFSPLLTCLAQPERADRIFTEMLTALGEVPELDGIDTMAVSLFAHQANLKESVVLNGFGARCADAVQQLDLLPQSTSDFPFAIEEVHWRDAVSIIEVKRALAAHLNGSPVFMEYFDFTPEFVAKKSEERESVHLIARDGDRIVGYIEATYAGENYLTIHPTMRSICGAGVLTEYRGRGIMRELIARLADRYRAEGITTLGVDYETMNPNARGFWERYFVPYTRSFERRFDRPWSRS